MFGEPEFSKYAPTQYSPQVVPGGSGLDRVADDLSRLGANRRAIDDEALIIGRNAHRCAILDGTFKH
ncbi:hypothetical protein MnTg02_03419 [bacterium MnTg02]|nr:hypothetical protein MnTg02_03419 [bacterium MnTg02]